jgi:CBS domain-containing protein
MVKDQTLGEWVDGSELLKVGPDTSVQRAAQLMKKHGKGAILVEEQGQFQGIFTERDMVFRVVAEGLAFDSTPISAVMSRDLVVGHPQDTHVVALRRMAAAGVRHLPVVNGSKLVGMVSRREMMALDIELMDAEVDRREASRLFI